VHKPELDVEGLDELLDLPGDLGPVLLQFRRGGHEHGVAEPHVLGDVEEDDIAVVDPGLNGELPAVEVRFHQYGKFFLRNGVDLVRSADHPVPQAPGLVEGLEVDRVVGVAVELEQGLVDPLEEADHVVTFVRLLEDAHTDTAELGATLHQCLVAQQ